MADVFMSATASVKMVGSGFEKEGVGTRGGTTEGGVKNELSSSVSKKSLLLFQSKG